MTSTSYGQEVFGSISPVNAGVAQLLHSYYMLMNDIICNIAIYADKTTLYSKSDQASDL